MLFCRRRIIVRIQPDSRPLYSTNSPENTLKTAQIIRRFSFLEWGGTETVVWNTVHGLATEGMECEILATAACDRAGQEERDGIRICRFPYFYPYWPMTAARQEVLDKKGGNPFSPALRRHLQTADYDLLHVHNTGRLAELVRMVSKQRKIPYIISFHGGFLDIPVDETRNMLAVLRGTLPYGGLFDRISGRKADVVSSADGILCVGINELEGLQARYPGKPILHLPNGVDPGLFRKKGSYDWREQLQLSSDCRLYLCVSRIDYQKNQLLLLRMMQRQRELGENSHLLLIGPLTVGWYAEQIRQTIAKEHLENRVTLCPGFPPNDERLIAAYQQAEVFFLPSLHEPFGIVVLEAWSAGLPVIASAVGGLKHLVHDGENGLLFKSDDLSSLLAACAKLAEPGVRQQLIRAATKEVNTHYTWTVICQRLAEFYRVVKKQFVLS